MDWIIPKKIYLCPWNRGCLPDYVLQSTPVSNKTRNLDKSQPFSVIISIIESTKIRKIHLSGKRHISTDKVFNAVFTPRVQPAHTHRELRTSVHGLWRQFPRLWHNRGLHHRYQNSYSPRHQACRAGWTGVRWCGS